MASTFIPFRDREIELKANHKVYRNLNNSMFSILAMSGPFKGKVVGHSSYVELSDVVFTISEKSRLRAVQEKTRNVHAFAIGRVIGFERSIDVKPLHQITYNPFNLNSFIYVHDSSPLSDTKRLILENGKAFTA